MPQDSLRVPWRPPKCDPYIETWLKSVPSSTTKPSPEELKQWHLGNRGGSGSGFYVTHIVLRAISLVAAVSVVILSLSIIASQTVSSYEKQLLPGLIICSFVTIWGAAEFITMCARGGQGIPWWIHIGVDGAIVVGTAIAIALGLVDLHYWLRWDYEVEDVAGEIACVALLFILMSLHAFLLIFFCCIRICWRVKKKTVPRTMHPPTGPVIVVKQEPVIPPAEGSTALANRTPPTPLDEAIEGSFHEPFRQGVPPRKPVAGAAVGTHYATPWPGPDYQPDEAERARAARGEKQAQWMTIHGMGLGPRGDGDKMMMIENPCAGRPVNENSSAAKARRI